MLKQRFITGILLAVVAIFGLLVLPLGNYFIAFVAFVLALASYEWHKMAKLSLIENIFWTFLLLLAVGLIWFNWLDFISLAWNWFVLSAIVFCAFMLISLYFFPHKKAYLTNRWIRVLIGLSLLTLTFSSLVFIKNLGNIYLIFIAITVILADTGAYFAGRAFGKRKLAPSVSPGKTWEGLIGGLLINAIYALIFANFFGKEMIFSKGDILLNSLIWISLVWAISLMSVAGDLFESMIKRIAAVKDSSNILPGHGGILDRLDGFTAALPTFIIGIFIFQNLVS